MRFIVYGTFLVFCCLLILQSEAQNKKFKQYDTANENSDKYKNKENKYKSYGKDLEYTEDNLLEKQICKESKCLRNKNRQINEKFENIEEKIHEKFIKQGRRYNDDGENTYHKRNKNHLLDNGGKIKQTNTKLENIENKSDKEDNAETEIFDEMVSSRKTRFLKYSDKSNNDKSEKNVYKKFGNSKDQNNSGENLNKKSRKNKKIQKDEVPSSEVTSRNFEELEDTKVSDEKENDDDDSGVEKSNTLSCSNRMKGKFEYCEDHESSESSHESSSFKKKNNRKKINFGIKFAHEKKNHNANKNDKILKKIHGVEKKRYNSYDSDESSEEEFAPKRLHMGIDEDED